MLSHNELPIKRLLDWKSIFIIVVIDAHIGVRIIGDVADDFEGVACEICGKPLVGRKQIMRIANEQEPAHEPIRFKLVSNIPRGLCLRGFIGNIN